MGFRRVVYCNRCRKTAPNPHTIPHGWIEFTSRTGGKYHFCKVCVVLLVAEQIRCPIDRTATAKAAGEPFSL